MRDLAQPTRLATQKKRIPIVQHTGQFGRHLLGEVFPLPDPSPQVGPLPHAATDALTLHEHFLCMRYFSRDHCYDLLQRRIDQELMVEVAL